MLHRPEGELTATAQVLYNECENHTFEITNTSPRGQWVNMAWYGIWVHVNLFFQ